MSARRRQLKFPSQRWPFFGTALGYKHRFFLQILLKKKITSIDQYVLRLPSFPSAIFRLRTSRKHHFCEKTARPPYLETTLIDALSLVLSSMLFARTASNFNMSYCPSSMVDKNVKYIVKSSVLLKRLQFQKHGSVESYNPDILRDTT